MRLKAIQVRHLAVPLKKSIRHASHARDLSDNLVVKAVLEDGTTGYGEGVPRPYVTGETIESTFQAVKSIDVARHLGQLTSFPSVVRRLECLVLPSIAEDPRGMKGNSARCALELAILDAYGRHFGESAGSALSVLDTEDGLLQDHPRRVRYSGAITSDDPRKEVVAAIKQRVYGFSQIKVKVGVAGQDDPERLRRLRKALGWRRDIRLDANEAWHPSELLDRVKPLLPYLPTVLEQPVPHAEVEALQELRPRLVLAVMLDESLCGYPDGIRAIEKQLADLFNIRLSKCGGIIASLRLVRLARSERIGVQLGCHPGETGLLSAAGRHFASRVKGIRYLEGSYDRHVLAQNIIREDITFGWGGYARPIKGPGLGVTVDPESLDQMTVKCEDLSYD